MTMLAYTLKNILELVPEALPFVKQASVEEEFPLDSKDSTIATALQLKYFEKIAYQSVNFTDMEKVAEAVQLYGVSSIVKKLSEAMVKSSEYNSIDNTKVEKESFLTKESSFNEGWDLISVEDRSTTACELYKQAKELDIVPSDKVILYSGNGFLSKEAAVKSLTVRYNETQNKDFVKLARAIVDTPDAFLGPEVLVSISDTISELDKAANLPFKGFDFYKEAFFIKEADFKSSMSIKLCGKEVPYEAIERVGKSKISAYIGEDVAKEMDSGPQNFKSVVESLPLDLQRILSNLIKNV